MRGPLGTRVAAFLDRHPLLQRLAPPSALFIGLFAFGSLGYFLIAVITGKPAPNVETLRNAIYQTAILLTTVGFGDPLLSNETWLGTIFTTILAFGGMGIILYVISSVTAFIVGGELSQILEARKMQKQIATLKDHAIICGGGETGRHVVSELIATQRPFVLIERDSERLQKLKEQSKDLLYLQMDACDDDVLQAAGVERAAGLVASLPTDKDNLLLVITARQLNPRLRIIARCIDLDNKKKLQKAGADSVVAPSMIGGMRMVSEMVRPATVTFLDTMLRDRRAIRFEDMRVPAGHALVGKTLAQANFPALAEVNIIATRESEKHEFVYNPRGNLVIAAGMDLVAVGSPEEIGKIRAHLAAPSP